jgi:rare lipoprotein A
MKKAISLFFLFAIVSFAVCQSSTANKQKTLLQKDTLKKSKTILFENEMILDSLFTGNEKLKLFKKAAHASYYADKFHGKKTASGKKFDMNKYTAAHKKLPFGTKVKITNEANGKSVIVEVTDRGPFVKSREIDLSKKAFMEIAKNTKSGMMLVTMELVVE